MSESIDGHRIANENEPNCKSCASFNNCKEVCDSILEYISQVKIINVDIILINIK